MKKASDIFSDADKDIIAQAVTSAESMTSSEIVPVIATISGRYDRAEDIFGVILALIFTAIYWFFIQLPPDATWAANSQTTTPFWPVILTVTIGFIFGAYIATCFPALILLFIPKSEMHEEVERRSLEMFQRQRLRTATQSNGVLIYVSLYEHMVRVVGDDAVNETIPTEEWDRVVQLIIQGMKEDQPENGLARAIAHCGSILQKHFPLQEDSTNKLNNGLVLVD